MVPRVFLLPVVGDGRGVDCVVVGTGYGWSDSRVSGDLFVSGRLAGGVPVLGGVARVDGEGVGPAHRVVEVLRFLIGGVLSAVPKVVWGGPCQCVGSVVGLTTGGVGQYHGRVIRVLTAEASRGRGK